MGLFSLFSRSKSVEPVDNRNLAERIGAKPSIRPRPTSFHVTLWPAFPHFERFSRDNRIQGIRLNSAMMAASEIDKDFERKIKSATVPLWFDIKGMQLRIREIVCGDDCDHLEFKLNRPIEVDTPCTVYFKAGEDEAELLEIRNGNHLIFKRGPKYKVKPGESIHIRQPGLKVLGPVFLDYEIEKISRVCSLGFTKFYLSYVYDQSHVDQFRQLIGPDSELILKIENREALEWLKTGYKPQLNTRLMTARGDLFVEVDYPHDILNATKFVVGKDPTAFVGSRMLLSCVNSSVPSCSDFSDLAWLYDIGYNNFLLCDELCLKENLLARAVNAFDAFKKEYCA